ncbi:MAG: hypothetical protein GX994_08580 [Firmicutes bacterium]|nr:hypothetical protein [Bacillota bacterium]
MNLSKRRIVFGGILLLTGWLIILGAVVGIVPQLVWLAFVAYAMTLAGFVIGIIGVIMYVQSQHKK